MKNLSLFLCIIIFSGCWTKDDGDNLKYAVDNRLLSFKVTKFADADSVQKLPKNIQEGILDNDFNPNIDTVIYGKSGTFVTCLTMATACGKFIGNLSFHKDTVKLKLINTSGVECSEQVCYRLFYKIDNPSLETFYIIKP